MSDQDLRALERDVAAGDVTKIGKLRRARCRSGECCAHAPESGEPEGARLVLGMTDAFVIVKTPARGNPWVIVEWSSRWRAHAIKNATDATGETWDELRERGFSVHKAPIIVRESMRRGRREARRAINENRGLMARSLLNVPSRGNVSGTARRESESD